jgi:tRNA (guanine37-N1)-methyltransferase
MLCLKVRKDNAEKVRKYLARRKLSDNNYRIYGSGKFIYIPIAGLSASRQLGALLGRGMAELSSRRFEPAGNRQGYRKAVSRALGGSEDYSKGYDVMGDIAIIDARSRKSALGLAKVIMGINKGIKTVLSKGGPVSGEYRTRRYVYVCGERKFDAVYRENGCTFMMDVRKAFFSPRLSYERGRIRSLATDGENVMVMFAGTGPFAIEVAKAHSNTKVVAIELNRNAYRYMVKNIKLNKAVNVEPVLGDVKEVALRYKGFADRIVMPLPKDSYSFIGAAVLAAKRRCVVHYYAFGSKDNALAEHCEKLRALLKPKGIRFRVLSWRVVRPYSASEVEIAIDFEMLKKKTA